MVELARVIPSKAGMGKPTLPYSVLGTPHNTSQRCMYTFVCVILLSILYTVYIQQCCLQHTVHYYVNFFEENIRNYSMGHTRMLPHVHLCSVQYTIVQCAYVNCSACVK